MLISKDTLKQVCDEVRDSKKIVFTNGCFDIIHAGHCQYLSQAANLGDILIVGLNSDDSVRRLKGENRPVNSEEDRAAVLGTLKPVAYVCVFEEDTPYELIKAVRPHVLVKGGDYKADDIVGNDIAEETVVLSFLEGRSTTKIISKMKG
jgi:D-beta-D-heptose 7-phosphate kinase/D-beta-D-heptose 1-phosphate adenosyltransferase